MSRRGENIHKRKDGRWEGRFICSRDIYGKAIYKSIYGKTYTEVRRKLLASRSEPRYCRDKMLFRELVYRWLNDNKIRYKKSTLTKYTYLIETHILPELGLLKVQDITSNQLNLFLEKKHREGRIHGGGALSPSYVRSITLIINAILQYGIKEGVCTPLKTPLHKPTANKSEMKILTKEEYILLKNYCCADRSTTALGILITLHTGLRISEVCALQWQDVDMKNRVLYVKHTLSRSKTLENKWVWEVENPKTDNAIRAVPISESLEKILQDFSKSNPEYFVLSNENTFLSPRTYEYRYHRFLKNNALPQINYHGLRHTFATRCVEAGMDVKTLSELLGHSNVGITLNFYVHSTMDRKRMEIEKLDKCF